MYYRWYYNEKHFIPQSFVQLQNSALQTIYIVNQEKNVVFLKYLRSILKRIALSIHELLC